MKSMKFNKKIIGLLILFCFIFGTFNTTDAFTFRKKKNNTVQAEKAHKKEEKKTENTEEKPLLTNETHSIFTLEDCINNAIKYNPDIRAAIYSDEAYKTKIGQAWANYFPKVGVGIGYTRNKFLPLFF